MKKITLLFLGIAISFAACKKSGGDEATPEASTPAPSIGPVPTTFKQKVFIEECTGAWCGWCVLGADGIKTAETNYPGRVNAIALHGGQSSEPMTVPEFQALLNFAGASGVPRYQLNRGIGGGFPGSFSSKVSQAMALTASCGLAIDASASTGNSVSFKVHAGFKTTLTGDYRLLVYLVEDSVKNAASAYNQQNYVSGDPGYTTNYYYNLPAVINNYTHKHVARKLLSASLIGGDQIPAANVMAGQKYVKEYTFTVPTGNGWNTGNLSVTAAILKYNASCASQVIMNSQTVKLGSIKNWD